MTDTEKIKQARNEYQREWRAKHPNYHRDWCRKHREEKRKYNNRWLLKQYNKTHPDQGE